VLKALIFDVDGTIAETEEAHRTAFNDTFPLFGLDWHWSRDLYRDLLKTTGGKERMRAYASGHLQIDADSLPLAEIHQQKNERYGALITVGTLPLRPGIKALIADARARGVRVAVATTTNRPNVDHLIRATMGVPADQVFEVIAAGDMVPNKKPAPEVYNLALEGLGLPAADCLALEDSQNGLRAARAAGISCLICPSGYTDQDDFTGATAVVDSFEAVASIDRLTALFAPA